MGFRFTRSLLSFDTSVAVVVDSIAIYSDEWLHEAEFEPMDSSSVLEKSTISLELSCFVLDLFDTCEIVCTCMLKDPFDTRKSFWVLIMTSLNEA